MFESGLDQAAGLRRLFSRRSLRVLPVASDAAETGAGAFVVNLAAALARAEMRALVIDGHPDGALASLGLAAKLELADLIDGDRRFASVALRTREGFSVLPAVRGLERFAADPALADAMFGAIASLNEPFDVAIVLAPGATLGALLARREVETAVLCGDSDERMTDAYGRMKSLVTRHGLSRFRVVFDQARSPIIAAQRHRRLAGVAQRFLGASVEFGGAVAAADELEAAAQARSSVFSVAARGSAARSFEQIAQSARGWNLAAFEAGAAAIH